MAENGLPSCITVGAGCELTEFEGKNLYDIYYNDGLFDHSKGEITIVTGGYNVVTLDAEGKFTTSNGASLPASTDGTVRGVMMAVSGFSSYQKGRLTGPDGNQMDTESFLASFKAIAATTIIDSDGNNIVTSGEEVPFRIVTQRYGKGIVPYGEICNAQGKIYVECIDSLDDFNVETADGFEPEEEETKVSDDDLIFKNENTEIPFDIFAATFYLISRYEEYLPHVKDQFERFPASESLAYQHKFLDKPMIDIWVYKFRDLLLSHFEGFKEELHNKKRKFNYISTIDIDNAYQFKHKGFTRSVGGILKDLSQFNIRNVWLRFMVVFGIRRDPFDMYKRLLFMKKKYKVKTIFFFLLGDYSTYDKNISPGNTNYKLLIKNIADYAEVGIHPSYFSMKNELKTKKEKGILQSIVNFPITRSRQHYLRIELPETYQNLVDLEIKEEYSMGYASHYGFRAGTCTPFYFYDLDFEIQKLELNCDVKIFYNSFNFLK